MTNYREWLKKEFEVRARRRPGYSLRAFARDLGVPAPKLSQTLRGICGISAARAEQIAKRLKFSDRERELFVAMVEAEHGRSAVTRAKARERLSALNTDDGFGELALERFRIISDWYHFAILELTDTADFKSDPRWIANRLGISVEETRKAIERLETFGLLEKDENGRYYQTHANIATPSGVPSKAIRDHHAQVLELAHRALEEVPVDLRDFSTMTMAINTDQLEEAKEALKEFRRKFCRNIQKRDGKDRVYVLSIQFFPVDKGGRK